MTQKENQTSNFHLLTFIFISLLTLASVLVLSTISLTVWNSEQNPMFQAFVLPQPLPYPILDQSFNNSEITATAYAVIDKATGQVILSKNPQFHFSPASTTKIMTSIVGRTLYQPDQVLTVKRATDEGVLLGLKPGDKITFTNLLYAMLLPSANDAAQTVADNHPQGRLGFIKAMNDYAAKLHLVNTHFSDPAGLDDDSDYTTPVELADITRVFLSDPLLAQIVTMRDAVVHLQSGKDIPVKSLNELLGLYGINGVKTGHTEGAKDVLVTSLPLEDHTIIIVVMSSNDRFADTKIIASQLVSHLHFSSIDL